MDLVPAIPDPDDPSPNQPTALVPLATTGLRRRGDEFPPVCLALSSSTVIGLRVYLEEFTRQLTQRSASTGTVATYRKRSRTFVAWLEQGRPSDLRHLDRACVEAYRAYLDQRFQNPRTKNGYLTAVRHFLIFLGRYHRGLVNAAEFVKGWSCSRTHTRRHLPVEDAKRLLIALETDSRKSDIQGRRNVAMAYLMLKTGLRTIEVSRARIAHLQELARIPQ
ncbi:MAG: hypothetical protein CV088_00970 [Nitrospira sp. LK70]|nr:hypothetical protein [Nitrospira sp. LK70]